MRPRRVYTLRLPDGRILELGRRTLVMGILNVTPDSFSDGGLHADPVRAGDTARRLVDEGADIIDVGGESTRPGAAPVPADQELARILPVIDRVRASAAVPISVDTYKADVARAALAHGASIVNDVSALRYDPDLAGVVAAAAAPVVLMHNRGRSRDMYREAHYARVPHDVCGELGAAVRDAIEAGVSADQIVVDPGLGFAKTAAHSLSALACLETLDALDRPILVGPSRKSFLTAVIGKRPPAEREWGTAAAVAAAVLLGAHIVRVHRVGEMVDVVRVADALARARGEGSA